LHDLFSKLAKVAHPVKQLATIKKAAFAQSRDPYWTVAPICCESC
jgi:hypothetical protein